MTVAARIWSLFLSPAWIEVIHHDYGLVITLRFNGLVRSWHHL